MNNCPACESSDIKTRYICTDKLVSGEEFPVVECSNCGILFTDKLPEESSFGSYYKSEDYISHSDTKQGLFNKIYHIARNRMLRQKFNIVCTYSGLHKGELLDIGCGTGYFPGYMKSKGWNAIGIESDSDAAAFAIEKFGIEILKPEVLHKLPKGNFNAVTLWHVLEHLADAKSLLPEISKLMSKDGVLTIAVPNNKSYDARMYREKWAAWDVPRHLWHFNISSLKEFIRDTDLELIKILRMPLDAFYVSVLSEKNYNSKLAIVKGFIIGFFGLIASAFDKSASSSLIYILKKKH